MPCPFEAKLGFSTKETRREYIAMIESSRSNDENDRGPAIDPDAIECLEADLDTTKPLYFWQLYSIIGKEPIFDFITTFYYQVFADEYENDGVVFRDAFVNVAPLHMHIKAQVAYWLDSFGGGRVYWGGHARLGFHHSSHHVEPVMTSWGAKRWLTHIKYAVSSYDFAGHGYDDPRIVPCIVDFLRTKVGTYAEEFGWPVDETDFFVQDYMYPPKITVGYKVAELDLSELQPIKLMILS